MRNKDKEQNKSTTKRVKYYTELMGPYEFLVDAQYSSSDQDDDFKGEIEIEPDLLEKLVKKYDELYISWRKSFLLQNHSLIASERSFITVNGKLNKFGIQDHLLGKLTIGCFPCNESKTKWFLFDVDVHLKDKKAIDLAKRCTKKLIKVLKSYIPEDYIHCYRSGSKGYHIVIYLDGPFDRQVIQKFQERIIILSGLSSSSDFEIEIRPYTKGKNLGQTAKLPLGRNFTNLEYGSNFCCFVTLNKLQYKPAQYKYFLNIRPLNRATFNQVINQVGIQGKAVCIDDENDDNAHKDDLQYETALDFVHSNIITAYGQRHDMLFDMARKLKSLYGLSKEETTEFLMYWLKLNEGKYRTPKEKAIEDAIFQVDFVYSKGYEVRGRIIESAFFAETDMNFLADIVNESGTIGRTELNIMEILVSMLRHAKVFLNNEFYMSYNEIIRRTGIVNRNLVSKYLKRLEELKKIEVVDRVPYKKGNSKANTYRINHHFDDVYTGYEIAYSGRIDVLEMMKYFYIDNQLKTMLTKTIYNELQERTE